jgi:hypothetical protein
MFTSISKKWLSLCSFFGLLCLSAADCGMPMMDDFPSELVDFVTEEKNPIFVSPGPGRWDSNMRERGWVMREGDSWSMWYTGYNAEAPVEKCSLGYATSQDGVSWQRYSDAPIHSADWTEDEQVWKDGDTYYMVTESEDDQSHILRSPDKLHWTRMHRLDIRYTDGTQVAPSPFGTPAVFKEAGLYYLMYEKQDDGIWLATSTDLKVFTNVQDEPVLTIGPGDSDATQVALNQIIKYQGRYYVYYNGQGRSSEWSTNIATSTDLIHWQKWSKNPLFPPEDFVNSAILVDDGDRFRLYSMHTAVKLYYSRARPVRDPNTTGPAFR